jgi:hypothetical protein
VDDVEVACDMNVSNGCGKRKRNEGERKRLGMGWTSRAASALFNAHPGLISK